MVLADGGKERLAALCDSLDAIEVRLRSHPTLSNTLDKEVLRQRASAEIVLQRVNDIRAEIETLERTSDEAKETANRYDRMERFQGRLEQALRLYDETDQSSQLRQEINGLREQIEELQRTISEAEIRRKLNNALAQIQNMASRLVPRLDAEWPESPIKLMIDDLTVKVVHGKRDDYLWEIGSGANWLAYHVAMTLALQKFFLTEPHHSVPSFLIYDQLSQVYFPKRAARNEEATLIEWRDQDVEAVRKVFTLLGQESLEAKGRLQIIVLDHADQEVWGDLPNVQLAEEWRGSALVPNDWITRQ